MSGVRRVDQGLLRDLAETMFASDEHGRLTGAAPHLHILRTPEVVISRWRAHLTDDVAEILEALAKRPRGRPSEWACEYADYARALSSFAPLRAIRAGPLYAFPETFPSGDSAVSIDARNAGLLLGGLAEWRPDVGGRGPLMGMVVDGRAVSICASVDASETAHCAGVETLPEYRGQGLAAQAVSAWARRVRAGGAAPFYGTTFDNSASQGVARRLGLSLVGSEFSIECETD